MWNHLLFGLVHGAKALFNMGSEKLAQRQTTSGSGFERHMRSTSSELGWPITKLTPALVSFSLSPDYTTIPYQIDVHCDGDVAHIHAISDLNFPPGRVPAAVQKIADDMDREQIRGKFVLVHTHREDFFIVACRIPMNELSGTVLRQVVDDILPFVTALDAILHDAGCVK